MHYSKNFLRLQWEFARHVAFVAHQPLADALREHTVLSHLLELPGDRSDPLWQHFLAKLQESRTPVDDAYDFYVSRQRAKQKDEQPGHPTFGCFSYVYPYREALVVRLHFENRDVSCHGALSRGRMPERKAELRQMFEFIQQTHPEAEEVWGGSWLYNLDAYRRIFPPEYTAVPTSAGYETGYFALWGQFLNGHGDVRQPITDQFLDAVKLHNDLSSCLSCFPFPVLRVKCRIERFYDFYDIGRL